MGRNRPSAYRVRDLALLATGVAALGWLLWFFGLGDIVLALRRASAGSLVLYLALSMASLAGNALRWRLVLRAVGGDLPLRRLIAARLAGDAVGYLVPSGRLAGDPVRIALVHASGASGTRTSASVTIDRLLEVTSDLLFGASYIAVFSLTHLVGSGSRTPLVLVVLMLLLMVALFVPLAMWRKSLRALAPLYTDWARRSLPGWERWGDPLQRTEDHLMEFFREHPGTFVRGFLVSFLIEAVVILEYHFLLQGFGVTIDLPTLLMTLLMSGFAHTAPTPGGLGALEASQVALLAVAGGGASVGFVIGMVMRLHETLWTAMGLLTLWVEGFSLARLRRSLSLGGAA